MSTLESQFATVSTISNDDRVRIVQQGQSRNIFLSNFAAESIKQEVNLPLSTVMDDADLVRVVDDGESKNITFDEFAQDVIDKVVFPSSESLLDIRTINSDDSIDITDEVIFVDSSLGDVNVGLPLAADSINGGRTYVYTVIKMSPLNTVFINPQLPSIIDNEDRLALTGVDGHVRIICDGVNYWTA